MHHILLPIALCLCPVSVSAQSLEMYACMDSAPAPEVGENVYHDADKCVHDALVFCDDLDDPARPGDRKSTLCFSKLHQDAVSRLYASIAAQPARATFRSYMRQLAVDHTVREVASECAYEKGLFAARFEPWKTPLSDEDQQRLDNSEARCLAGHLGMAYYTIILHDLFP